MAYSGLIHEKLDIKILILFILRRLPGEVSPETLIELCHCDDGFDYFDFSNCLAELVETGHVTETEDGYTITEKGERNADAVESSLPYSVRTKAIKLIVPAGEAMRRAGMITARHTKEAGGYIVELALSDGQGEILHLNLLASDEAQAKQMERNFKRQAEKYYHKFVEMLSEKKKY